MDSIVDSIVGDIHNIQLSERNRVHQRVNETQVTIQGSNTQLTSTNHEMACHIILKEELQCQELVPISFRGLLTRNDHTTANFTTNPQGTIDISNMDGLECNVNYIVHQPFGSQRYPDIIIFRINDGIANILYVECKQLKPTWNNTPAKRCRHCIYICGNTIFCGELLVREDDETHKEYFIQKYRELVEECNGFDTNYRFVQYKKIELKNWPPPCFMSRQDENIPLINQTLSRFY